MSQIDSRLANRILIGLGVGALAGSLVLLMGAFAPGLVKLARELSTAVLDPFGQIFLRMLFFVVIPLIFASLVIGVVQLGRLSDLGPLAGKTFSLFALNMIIGVALGLLMMNILEPGAQLDAQTQARLTAEYGSAAESYVQRRGEQPAMSFALLVDMLMPRNLLGAFVGNDRNILGEVLPLILFALLVGAAGTQLAPARRVSLLRAMESVAELMYLHAPYALLVDMLMPRNLLGASVGKDRNILGEVLPLILFALLVGAAGTQLAPERRESLQRAMETVAELMTRIVHFALRLAPYAVPALIFSVIVKAGFEILIALGLFVLGCLAVMALHLFGTFSAWLKLGTRRKPRDFFKAVAP